MNKSESDPKSELIKAGVEVVKVAYDDALKPVATQTGKALGTVGQAVNAALDPLRGVIWTWDKIGAWVSETVSQKLEQRGVSKERIVIPNPDVAVPTVEALRYTKLKDQFANLLATSMDSTTAIEAHPAFVEILKQITPDEAKILQFLPRVGRNEPLADLSYAVPEKGEFPLFRHVNTICRDIGCNSDAKIPDGIDNLCRLGLTEIPPMRMLTEDWRYDRIRELPLVAEAKKRVPQGGKFIFIPKMLGLTILGQSFRDACIDDRIPKPSKSLQSTAT